jgi:hypothetical protein
MLPDVKRSPKVLGMDLVVRYTKIKRKFIQYILYGLEIV